MEFLPLKLRYENFILVKRIWPDVLSSNNPTCPHRCVKTIDRTC